MWAKNYKECRECKTTEIPHQGHGLCRRCWQRDYLSNPVKKRQRKKVCKNWYNKNLKGSPRVKLEAEHRRFGGMKPDVLKRDDYKCTLCGSTKALCVHHKNKNKSDNNLDNLQTLCYPCHGKIHAMGDRVNRWSVNYDSCIECGTTEVKHTGHGLCHNCYSRKWKKGRTERRQRQ